MATFKPEITTVSNQIKPQFWLNSDFIDANTQVRNLSGWWTPPVWWIAQHTSGAGTWNQSITWVWFQPSFVTIQAVYAASAGQLSFWHASSSADDVCVFISTWAWWAASYNNARIIDVWSSRASFVSMDSDWFTINWTSSWVTVDFIYQCFR